MRPNIRLSAAITALLLASAPAGALVHSASSSSASGGASSTATASAEAVTASVASGAVNDSAAASTAVAAAEASAADTFGSGQNSSSIAAAGPVNDADQAGSTEVKTEQRSCGAESDPHYEPPSGQGLEECKDPLTGDHDDSRTYTAKHFTNEVDCGEDDLIVPDTSVLNVNGDGDAGAGGGSGYLQVCSDKALPAHGRITFEGEGDSGGFAGSLTADGDETNHVEGNDQATGWAQVNVDTSGNAPSIRCGKAYSDDGRADASNPTDEDTQAQCG